VENLALSLQSGDVLGLVGANGGGKTTTLRMLAGILKPDLGGRGQVLDFDLVRNGDEIGKRVGYMPQRLSFYAELSVFENLRFRAEVYGLTRPRAAAEAVIENFELGEYARTIAGRLSGGWARRLQLAAALIHSPRLILLDEPTAGLDATSRQEVWRRIERFVAEGAGVIVSTHDLAEAERCSHALFLSQGRVVAAGQPADVAAKAPAVAFLLYGAQARRFAGGVDALPGVIASYPQGSNLRIVADTAAEVDLRRFAAVNDASLGNVMMRLEDAALVFSRPSSRTAS
jgi:ABC-type multidrug transport system ATPase subunit